ncbi:hypothetical protein K469DRAFT_23939 [Zopfia rhizophila CBS 207.26]|uniref:Uncharacterized protein n=1 Tax=Zopfia rhizophila CBS 207.26 TaxID=1314779 RepID=A0A6A6EJ15_9PEZI|nr:hypothetical protein K469DRAFT_23939 [Zopfia rhizophila CBS 207.26]
MSCGIHLMGKLCTSEAASYANTRLYTGQGREHTAPIIVGFVVTMFYYAINIIYPTMIAVFFTDTTTNFKYGIVLTLPQNLDKFIPRQSRYYFRLELMLKGLCFGAAPLTIFARKSDISGGHLPVPSPPW